MTIPPDLEAQILRYYHVEKWRVGTIARQLHVHHGTVIGAENYCQHAEHYFHRCPRAEKRPRRIRRVPVGLVMGHSLAMAGEIFLHDGKSELAEITLPRAPGADLRYSQRRKCFRESAHDCWS